MQKSPRIHIALFGCLLGIVPIVVFGRPSAVDSTTRVVISASDIAQLRAGWVYWSSDIGHPVLVHRFLTRKKRHVLRRIEQVEGRGG